VEMVEPKPGDVVCDPACGTCGFLVAVGEYLRQNHKAMLTNKKQWEHFNHHLFHGFDFDNTMLRIGSMTQSGWMEASQLYESPFTDFSPKGVEGVFNPDQVKQLIGVLSEVRQRAAVAA
jgi:hypothetical protein